MPAKLSIKIGARYGNLTVNREDGYILYPSLVKHRAFICRCDCGRQIRTSVKNIVSGNSKSCGCPQFTHKKKHGHASKTLGEGITPTYRSWRAMLTRCNNSNHPRYARYGGRGITIDDRWKSFLCFIKDMGERPEGKTLDRIDNDRGYSKDNCKWSTYKEQAQNRRRRVCA